MSPLGWLTLGVVGLVFLALTLSRRPPDLILVGGLTLLLALGAVDERQAFTGFSNEGVLTVGVLYIVAAAMRDSGAIWLAIGWLFKQPRSILGAQARIMFPVAACSAFLNNTPLVLMLLPVIGDWAKKFRLPVSKLLIPLSYASLLGGLSTLIGTSTNLICNGLLISESTTNPAAVEAGLRAMSLFEIAWVGLPVAAVGITYLLVGGRWLLPDRRPAVSALDDPREYMVEMVVEEGSPLVGERVEDAGLRHLPGLYLVEIDRDGDVIAAVGPDERLRAHDRLLFTGILDSVVDLQKIRGLAPATNQVSKISAPRAMRTLIEAVVSDSMPIVGMTIREGRFRTRYGAAVIAVARNGERIKRKVGDIVLQPGDTLLLEAPPSFQDRHRLSRDFYLLSRIEGYTPPNHERAPVALATLAGLVVAVSMGWVSMLLGAMLACGVLLATRTVSTEAARRSVDWRLLVAIASAFGIGEALKATGAAQVVANGVVGLAAGHVLLAFVAVYFTTMVFTEIITNNASAVLMFPIAVATAMSLDVSPMPFVVGVMIAASCGFATPIGYQTHLMVMGPGGYRFTDFLKVGVPLNLIVMATATVVIPMVWPF